MFVEKTTEELEKMTADDLQSYLVAKMEADQTALNEKMEALKTAREEDKESLKSEISSMVEKLQESLNKLKNIILLKTKSFYFQGHSNIAV